MLETESEPSVPKNAIVALDDNDPDSIKDTPFDVVIWCGDLNYRINGVVGAITHAMKKDMYEVLLYND